MNPVRWPDASLMIPSTLQDVRTLAESIEHLFSVTLVDGEPPRPWRGSEVVAQCRAAGFHLSASHLSEMRRGVKANPTMATLRALSWFFDVPTVYFFDPEEAASIDEGLARRRAATLARARERVEAEQDAAAAAVQLGAALRALLRTRSYGAGRSASDLRHLADEMRRLATFLTCPAPPNPGDWRARAATMRALTAELQSA